MANNMNQNSDDELSVTKLIHDTGKKHEVTDEDLHQELDDKFGLMKLIDGSWYVFEVPDYMNNCYDIYQAFGPGYTDAPVSFSQFEVAELSDIGAISDLADDSKFVKKTISSNAIISTESLLGYLRHLQ